jgi:hypothetical protein
MAFPSAASPGPSSGEQEERGSQNGVLRVGTHKTRDVGESRARGFPWKPHISERVVEEVAIFSGPWAGGGAPVEREVGSCSPHLESRGRKWLSRYSATVFIKPGRKGKDTHGVSCGLHSPWTLQFKMKSSSVPSWATGETKTGWGVGT